MARIYISSTFKDLQKERENAAKAVRQLGHQAIYMEEYVASDVRPADKCIGDVKGCDAYVGIFAFRYGDTPPGCAKSITHLEYEAAIDAGIPCLIFLLDKKALWPIEYADTGAERDKIEQLRKHLEERHTCKYFSNADQLGGLVSATVSKTPLPPPSSDKGDKPTIDPNPFPKIPGYRIERELGSGGMGTVYLGIHEKLKRQVAIKVLHPWLLKEQRFAKQFLREAKIAANLMNPHIISFYDVGQDCSFYYIVMEYLTGGSLKDKIQKGPLGVAEALAYLRQMSIALCIAHQKGVVHRDIKSDNIMFRQDGAAVLTDFGVARSIDVTTLHSQDKDMGSTPKYMSPEQAKGEEASSSSDIYSLGIVFYEMLVGSVPYDGKNGWAIGIKHIQEPIPLLPAPLSRYQTLLNRMLAKEPKQRFVSAKELNQVLEEFLAQASLGEFSESTESPEVFMPIPGTEPIIAGIITVKGVSYEMVAIPGGEFQMGAENGLSNEKPVHPVQLDAFQLGKTPVTQGLWQAVMGTNPSYNKKGDNYPVEQVSWNDCLEFIKKLNELTGGNYRLPNEAEWEYACRAGTTGDTYGKLDEIAWYDGNSGSSTHPVGQKLANSFGLYDMLGNVWEWCQDLYDGNYYTNSPVNNPKGPDNGSFRVLRGGSFGYFARFVRCAGRFRYGPGYRYRFIGFRLAAGSAKR